MLDELTLNEGQQTAADGFFAFMFDTIKAIIISGGGGVGKSYLISVLVDIIMPRYLEMCTIMGIEPEYDEVVLTATTNQAAQILAASTGRPVQTIHSFLNLTVKTDFETGKTYLAPTKAWKVYARKVIFVDECSTEDPPVMRFLDEATHKCKIVHVGDHCQLGPIGYTRSPLYDLGLPFYELTEPMRNATQPALMALCQQLRTTVETLAFKDIQLVPGVIDHFNDEQLEKLIEDRFSNSNREDRILAYTNKRVVQYNDHIRTLRGLPDTYTVGEFLINNTALKLNGNKVSISVDEEVEIIDQAKQTEQIVFDQHEGVPIGIEIRMATLRSRIGFVYDSVPIPVDRAHVDGLIDWYKKRKIWQHHYFIKEYFPDLRQREASTVHKAQGSSCDLVIIDLGDLSTCHIPAQMARLLYVAVSRAKYRVVFYGELAPKYGRLVNE